MWQDQQQGIGGQHPGWGYGEETPAIRRDSNAPQRLAYVAEQWNRQNEPAESDSNPSITVDSYYNLTRALKGTGQQAHHLNQDAVFKNIIPKKNGLCIGLSGNAFGDNGSGHYNAHCSLERFWDLFRKGGSLYGERPTVGAYNGALHDSVMAAGLNETQADFVVMKAQKQQENYNLYPESLVPRIPRRINQKR